MLVAGQLAGAAWTGRRGAPIPAALPATTAALLHLSVGDVLRLSGPGLEHAGDVPDHRPGGAAAAARRRRPTGSSTRCPPAGRRRSSGFTTYGPLLVTPAAFGAALPVSSATWVAQPDMAAFTDTDLGQVAADVSALQSSVASSAESSGAAAHWRPACTTGLAGVLSGTAENLAVARSLLAISAVQLLVLTVAALLAVARLLAAQREGETALLTARGATRWQLTRLTATEVIPLSLRRRPGRAASRGSGWPGCSAAPSTAGRGTRHRRHQRWPPRAPGSTRWPPRSRSPCSRRGAALPGAAARPAPARAAPGSGAAGRPCSPAPPARARTRPDRARGAGRLAAAPLLGRLAVGGGGPPAIDPVLVLAPALALAGGTVLTLRLLPAAARGRRPAGRRAAAG